MNFTAIYIKEELKRSDIPPIEHEKIEKVLLNMIDYYEIKDLVTFLKLYFFIRKQKLIYRLDLHSVFCFGIPIFQAIDHLKGMNLVKILMKELTDEQLKDLVEERLKKDGIGQEEFNKAFELCSYYEADFTAYFSAVLKEMESFGKPCIIQVRQRFEEGVEPKHAASSIMRDNSRPDEDYRSYFIPTI